MITVGRYMTRGPHTIGREQPLAVARQAMRQNKVRHLPVLHGGELVGVLSDRELEMLEAMPGSSQLTVEDAMVPDTYVTGEDAPLAKVATELARLKLGSAIVVKGSEVVGMFTAVDALRALADALGAESRPASA
jgi:acetoin utilization protein AcuB